MAIQPDGPSSKYNASHHTTPPFATRKRTSTSVAARPGRTNLRTDYRCVTQSRRPHTSDVYSARHAPFGRKRRGPRQREGARLRPDHRRLEAAARAGSSGDAAASAQGMLEPPLEPLICRVRIASTVISQPPGTALD